MSEDIYYGEFNTKTANIAINSRERKIAAIERQLEIKESSVNRLQLAWNDKNEEISRLKKENVKASVIIGEQMQTINALTKKVEELEKEKKELKGTKTAGEFWDKYEKVKVDRDRLAQEIRDMTTGKDHSIVYRDGSLFIECKAAINTLAAVTERVENAISWYKPASFVEEKLLRDVRNAIAAGGEGITEEGGVSLGGLTNKGGLSSVITPNPAAKGCYSYSEALGLMKTENPASKRDGGGW
jgi:hypothetical protein